MGWKDSTGRIGKQCQPSRGCAASWFPLISFRPHLPALPTSQACWRWAICCMSPISVFFKHWCRPSCCHQHSQSCRRQFSNTWGLESCPLHYPVLFQEVRVLRIGATSTKMHWNHTGVVQLLSHVWLFASPWTAAHQASLSLTISWSLLKLIHWVSDAVQPSHPLSPSSSAFSLSQHQALFQWVGSSHRVVKVLKLQLQHQSFQRVFRVDFL